VTAVPEHQDALRDAVALVECAASDPEGFGAVLRNCDQGKTVVVLAKLLRELLADNDAGIGACPGSNRGRAKGGAPRTGSPVGGGN